MILLSSANTERGRDCSLYLLFRTPIIYLIKGVWNLYYISNGYVIVGLRINLTKSTTQAYIMKGSAII